MGFLQADAVSTFSGSDGLREICDLTGAGGEIVGGGVVEEDVFCWEILWLYTIHHRNPKPSFFRGYIPYIGGLFMVLGSKGMVYLSGSKYLGVDLKVVVLSVVCDDLWYAKMTFAIVLLMAEIRLTS